MKKLLCFLLTVITVLSAFSLTAAADNDENSTHHNISSMIVFGDSIPAGYALPGYTHIDNTKAQGCFVNILCEEYGLEFGSSCMNHSYPGLTTDEILKKIKDADKTTLKNSDVIIISAGANDIMDSIEEAVTDAFIAERENLENNGIEINTSDLLSFEKTIFNVITNPDAKEAAARIYTACTDEKSKRAYTDTILKAENNIKEIISYIRETGSNAEIIFLVPYNPTEIITGNPLLDTAKELLNDYRSKLTTICDSSEYGYSANTIDLLSDFEGKALELTNISSFDIHPNKNGHARIAELASELIDTALTERETEMSKKETMDAPYSDTVVYIIFSTACIAVLLILIIGIIKYKRKEL